MSEHDREFGFLDSEHPVYTAWTKPTVTARDGQDTTSATDPVAWALGIAGKRGAYSVGAWERNERRMRGGEEIFSELRPFDWELADGGSYRARQATAEYPNFPDEFATITVGHLMRDRPRPGEGLSFGGMGEIRRERDTDRPTMAEQIYYNATGTGGDGQQWDAFWGSAMRKAEATGHRWIFVEAPQALTGGDGTPRKPTERDVIQGHRPYLVEYSPTQVPNWDFVEGQLDWIIIRVPERRLRLDDEGKLVGNEGEDGYLFMTREGCQVFGDEYSGGGWWRFSSDKEPLWRGEDGSAVEGAHHGTWEKTEGQIPMAVLFYEEDNGTKTMPAMSRPAITELGNLAVGYMNLSSAADFDAWDAAASIHFLLGVDAEEFNVAAEAFERGSRFIPIPASKKLSGDAIAPTVTDGSTGAVTADVYSERLEDKRSNARRVAGSEATSSPDSSGRSKEAGFTEGKSPRLALMAENLETAQNTIIRFLELRSGVKKPSGFVEWPREFDLQPLGQEIADFLDRQGTSGLMSATATAKALTLAAKEARIATTDEELNKIEKEYLEDAEQQIASRAQSAAMDREIDALLGGGGGGEPDEDDEPDEDEGEDEGDAE